jgi:A/G-specific adenine glycosylase
MDAPHLTAYLSRQRRKGNLNAKAIRLFQDVIRRHYRENGRVMPWRRTRNPYRIVVSEVMLQQTQVERVLAKYNQFISAFPDFRALAGAPTSAVLKHWQGLGYNRRALALKQSATIVMETFAGRLPRDPDVLMTLPGIGRATASAIAAFAFNKPVVFIETNIRRVFIHFFFDGEGKIHDADISPLVEQTLDTSNPREWYYGLMDYGVELGKNRQNPNRRSAHYTKQSPFEGSDRQLRGQILRALLSDTLTARQLSRKLGADPKRMIGILGQLQKEGFIEKKGALYRLP